MFAFAIRQVCLWVEMWPETQGWAVRLALEKAAKPVSGGEPM